MTHNWQPLYTYHLSLLQKLVLLLCSVITLFFLTGTIVVVTSSEPIGGIILGILCLTGMVYIFRVINAPRRIIKILSEKNVEFYDAKGFANFLFVKTADGSLGLFDRSAKKSIFEPDYIDIVVTGNFFLLEDKSCKWGVYNRNLKKIVLPFEFSGVYINKEGNIVVTKNARQYEYSPYGSFMN